MVKISNYGKGSVGVIILAIIVVTIVSSIGYMYWQKNIKNDSVSKNKSTQDIAKTDLNNQQSMKRGTEIISLDDAYNKYLNYDLGISIDYSKTVAVYTECIGTAPQVGSSPTKIIENIVDNKIYLSSLKHVRTISHQTGPGEYQGFDSCIVGDISLEVIKNKVSDIDINDWIFNMEFSYRNINDTSELDSFIESVAPSGMVIDHSVVVSLSNGIHSYTFKYVGDIEASAPNPNKYYLIYSPSKHLAVFWANPNQQQPTWVDIDKDGKYVNLNVPAASIIL